MNRRRFIGGAAAAAASAGLSGCAGGPDIILPWNVPPVYVERIEKDGNVELALNAVDVWDSQNAGAPEELTVDGKKMWFRLRDGGFLERSWMRAGLFWHSRHERIFLTTVVLGQPVRINKLDIKIGHGFASLSPSTNLEYNPAKRPYDQHLSSQIFAVKPSLLYALPEAKEAAIVVSTDRGRLTGDLLAVPNAKPETLRQSARVLFSDFIGQQRLIAGVAG